VIIDVSQAVDLDHPKALDFLREDARHINDFFRRAGVAVLTARELFDFVVDPAITADTEDEALSVLQAVAARCAGAGGAPGRGRMMGEAPWAACGPPFAARPLLQPCASPSAAYPAAARLPARASRACSRPLARNAEEETEDAVFAGSFIPRRLEEVAHYERDREALAAGQKVRRRGEARRGGSGLLCCALGWSGKPLASSGSCCLSALPHPTSHSIPTPPQVEGLYYQAITGMADDLSGPRSEPMALQQRRDKAAGAVGAAAPAGKPAAAAGGAGKAKADADAPAAPPTPGPGEGKKAKAGAAAKAGAKASRGKGPSFLAFLPKAEDQVGPPPTSKAPAAADGGGAGAGAWPPQAQQPMDAGQAAAAAAATAGDRAGKGSSGEGGGSGRSSSSSSNSSSGSSDSDDEASCSGSDGSGSEDEGSGSGDEGGARQRKEPVDRDAERAARKAHKKDIKEANRERRKSKIPKHVKKAHKKKSGKK
jgi:hypothetical protein